MTIIDDVITHTIDQLIPDPNNVRHDDTDGIDELLASILNRGLIQPITIRPDGVIVAGHRRRSAIKLGIETGKLPASYPIPVYVKLDATDDNSTESMLIENMQRQDLDPIEQAQAFDKLKSYGLTQAEVAARIGKSATLVSQRLRLLTLPDTVQAGVSAGRIDLALAEEFTKIADFPNEIVQMVDLNLSIDKVQQRVDKLKADRKVIEICKWIEDAEGVPFTAHQDVIIAGFMPDYETSIRNPKKDDIASRIDPGDHVLVAYRLNDIVVSFCTAPEPKQASSKEEAEDPQKVERQARARRKAAIADAIRTAAPSKGEVDRFVNQVLPILIGATPAKEACRFLGLVDSEIMEAQGVSDKVLIQWSRALGDAIMQGGRTESLAKMALVMAVLEAVAGTRDTSIHHDLYTGAIASLGIELDEHDAPVHPAE